MVKDLFKRSGIYAGLLVVGRGLTLILFILLARILQPKLFGDAVLFVTLNQFFTFFADFGLNQWYMKQADRENKTRLFEKVVTARLATLAVSIFFSVIFLLISKSFNQLISLLLIISLVPEAFLSIVDGYYLEKKQSQIVALKPIIRNLFILMGIFFLHRSLSLEVVILLYLISAFINLLIIFPWKIISAKFLTVGNPFSTIKQSTAYAFLIFTSYLYARGDHLIIKYLLNSYALGIYSSAYRYLEALSLIPTALTQNLFPISAKKSGIHPAAVKKIFLISGLFGVIIGLCLFLLSDFLIIQVIGISYQTAMIPLRIFSLVIIMFFINAPLSTIVQSSNLLKKFLPLGIANTLLNLILNVIFVPSYGINAAAWTMLITELSGFFINLYFIRLLYKAK